MTKSQTQNTRTRNWLPLIGLLLLAFALRIYRLDAQSLWVDEGISLHLATSSLAEIVANRAANIHPPLYFFLLKEWVALTGVNIYTARFLSAMGSLLQVPIIYAVARRWIGRPAAQIAAWLTAISPLSIVYAQEIRAYALLPLVYLALLSITHALTQESTANHRATWLPLGVVEVIGLHLHYTTLFLVAYTAAWTILIFWKKKRWADLRRWIIIQLLVGLACLPWLITMLAHWSDVQAEATAGITLAQPPPLNYLLSQIWVFHLTGLPGTLGHLNVQILSVIILLSLTLLLLIKFTNPSTRRTIAQLLAQWIIPLSIALLAWTVRPFSHPRYIILYTPGLTLLIAYAILPKSSPFTARASHITHHALCLALTISLIAAAILALWAYFFDPAFSKDNVRSVAHYLEERTGADDLILVTDGDWSLPLIYQGTASVEMPGLSDEETLWANLVRLTAQRRQVFVMSYERGIGRDERGLISFALEKAGTLHTSKSFGDILVRQYQLDLPVQAPTLLPFNADFGPIALTQSWVEAQADTALTLALHWQMKEPAGQRYGLAIRLLDTDGWPLTTHDDILLDAQTRPTDYWAAGQETTTYHVLPIPPAIPPLSYTLNLGLYEQTESDSHPLDLLDNQGAPQGQWLDIANVHLTTSLTYNPYGTEITPPRLAQPADLADGLRLLGAALDRSTLAPGQSLFVILHWQATHSPLPNLHPRLALVQAGKEINTIESAPALDRYPTNRWQNGETVIEHRRLVVSLTATDGPADVTLAVGNQRLLLGQIEINAQEHTFTPPPITYPLDVQFGHVARLIGYDLPSYAIEGISTAEPITLTLYWQALEGTTDTNYTVFTHILAADGHLVGGHDSPPSGGARPTLGWIPDEIITDQHMMTLREPYTGLARIEVGLYDPITMERVPTLSSETFILLPTTLTIREN